MTTHRASPKPSTSASRDRLFHDHLALARAIAARVHRCRARSADLDDLYSVACLALLQAVRRFDPARGTPFAAYARVRIRGAVLDHLRGGPSRHGVRWVSLDERPRSGEGRPLVDRLAGAEDSPYDSLVERRARHSVRDACASLPERDRRVIELCYFEHKTLGQAGRELGVSGSRIHQIRDRALTVLRERLEGRTARALAPIPLERSPKGLMHRAG